MAKHLNGSNQSLNHEAGGGGNVGAGLAVDRPESTHGRQNPSADCQVTGWL